MRGRQPFRHTFSTLLKACGVDIKVMQELLRHANSRITLDIYTQAMSQEKTWSPGACGGDVLTGSEKRKWKCRGG